MPVLKLLPLDLGSSLLGGFFSALFDRLLPHSWPYIFVPEHEVQSVLNKWSTKLAMIQAVLDDAEKKQLTNMAVKVWLEDLQDFAYDLEDMLDEYNTTILERNSNARPSTDDDIISIAREELALLLDKLDAISNSGSMAQRLEELCERRSLLELLERTVGGTSTAVWQRPPSSCVIPDYIQFAGVPTKPAVYGRDEDKSKILQMIARDDSTCSANFRVISIVGMAGVGKTTLAQAVYNDTDFDRKAWVCISNDFDVFKISMAILESITHSSYDLKNLNEVQVQLKLAITGRRFLIVLDDVWSKNYNLWETLKSPFVTGARGSRIIMTTRSIDVALKAGGPNDYYDLKLLSDEDCWSVFTKHAFEDIDAQSNLEAVREKVVKKCGGLPLAARTLGGLLRSKERNDEWEDILNSKIWDLPEESDILRVLKLSYYHLPSHLKRCLAYCAILPKNYEFEEKELVLLWMAEGLVLPSANGKQLEDIGSEYFRDLLSRSIFQKSSGDHTCKFVMHNLINDLAQWTSGETVFKLEDKSEANTQSTRFRRARHSSYICGDFDGKKKFEVFDKVESLRSILPVLTQIRDCFIKDTVVRDLLSKFTKLRVLSLRRYNISELPEDVSISNLRYLRYLNLSDTKIDCLPQWINELYNLQILLLRNCDLLGDLPSSMGNLINLLHLDISGASSITKMPCGMEKLEYLQTLSDFIVSKNTNPGSNLKELKNLKLLRGELRISPLQNVNNLSELRGGILSDKKNLQVLILEWGSEFGNSRDEMMEKYVLDMLRPHTNLTKLTIKHYGGLEFPFWIGDPIYLSNMVALRLEDCKNCTSLPPLGLLGSLKDLTISGMTELEKISCTFYGGERCSRPFQSLETLRLENLEKLKELEVCDTSINNEQVKVFQCLGELCIVNCLLLSGRLPEDLPKLQKLVIQKCPALVISFSSFPMLCELEIDESREMGAAVWRVEDLKVENCLGPFLELFPPSRLTALEIKACSGTSLQTAMQSSTCLRRLKIEGCNSLEFIVLDGSNCQASCLEHLYISGCPSLRSLVETGQLPETLKHLEIKDCSTLKKLSSGQLPETLKHLEIKDCSMLNTLSSSGQLPTSLERFEINNCGIISIPFGQHNYGSLREIEISNCIQLGEFLGGGLQMTNLRKFSVSYCQNLVALPSSMHYFYYLEELRVFNCSSLNTIALQQISLPINLTSLKIEGDALYDSLVNWGLHKLTSLRKLVISGCTNETHFPRLDTMLPASLNDLSLANFSNLTTLSFLGFQNLTSLEYFTISNCRNNIRNFPQDLPSSLLKLEVFHCDLLERRIAPRGGQRTPCIANIPFVKIGGVLI